VPVEGEVVVLESFGVAQGTRAFRHWCLDTSRRLIGRFSRGGGRFDLHWFDLYIRNGLIEVIKAGISAEILLQFAHKLCKECERNWRSDIGWRQVSEVSIFFIKR